MVEFDSIQIEESKKALCLFIIYNDLNVKKIKKKKKKTGSEQGSDFLYTIVLEAL